MVPGAFNVGVKGSTCTALPRDVLVIGDGRIDIPGGVRIHGTLGSVVNHGVAAQVEIGSKV